MCDIICIPICNNSLHHAHPGLTSWLVIKMEAGRKRNMFIKKHNLSYRQNRTKMQHKMLSNELELRMNKTKTWKGEELAFWDHSEGNEKSNKDPSQHETGVIECWALHAVDRSNPALWALECKFLKGWNEPSVTSKRRGHRRPLKDWQRGIPRLTSSLDEPTAVTRGQLSWHQLKQLPQGTSVSGVGPACGQTTLAPLLREKSLKDMAL